MDQGSPLIYSQRYRRVTIGDHAMELFIYIEDHEKRILEVVTYENISWALVETVSATSAQYPRPSR